MQCLDGRDPLVGQLNWIRPSRRLSSHSGPILKRPEYPGHSVPPNPFHRYHTGISSMLSIRSPGSCRLANHCATNLDPRVSRNELYLLCFPEYSPRYHGVQVRYHTAPCRTAFGMDASYYTINICTARGLFRFEPRGMSHLVNPKYWRGE